MKIYDYKCEVCHTIDERLVKSQHDVVYCKCGGLMNRMVSAPGMVKTNFADKTGFKPRRK